MVHNICAKSFEGAVNTGLEMANFEYGLEGFCLRLQEQKENIDAILGEIAQENPEILSYFKSPYTRLMICWSTCALGSIKKMPKKMTSDIRSVNHLSYFSFYPYLDIIIQNTYPLYYTQQYKSPKNYVHVTG